MPIALSSREPVVSVEEVLAELKPPPTFADVCFGTFRPDSAEPTQQQALSTVERWTQSLAAPSGRRALLSGLRRKANDSHGSAGLYLDGGFGVGKTHLLAAAWHAAPDPKLFATFVELTHLVGALGFSQAVDRLSTYRLICIDEFELDDPGDTVLVSNLLARLVRQGARVAVTSNTLPDRLGEGRFAAEDFLREIQALAQNFEVIRINGPDYRHRDLIAPPPPYDEHTLDLLAQSQVAASDDHFVDLCRHLAELHPSRYGALLEGVELVCLHDVRRLSDQSTALRLVVLVDRLYDRGIPVAASGVPFDQMFGDEMLASGFRKKYFRALSRLGALAREVS